MEREYVVWLDVRFPSDVDKDKVERELEDLADMKPLPHPVIRVEVNSPVEVEGKVIVALCIPFRCQTIKEANKRAQDFVEFFAKETAATVEIAVPPYSSS